MRISEADDPAIVRVMNVVLKVAFVTVAALVLFGMRCATGSAPSNLYDFLDGFFFATLYFMLTCNLFNCHSWFTENKNHDKVTTE